jgi:predicted RNA-binding Zn-ribbon protein involved in translation (DUF1610 family)
MGEKQPVRVKARDFNLTAEDFDKLYAEQGDGAIASYLEDGEHVIIQCSNCRKTLADVWITQPDFELKSEIVAHCPFCGDKSFKTTVQGAFHLGHTDKTTIDHVEQETDLDAEGKLIQTVVLHVEEG